MKKIYDQHNFHKHTFCVFTEVANETISGRKPDYKSKSGSSYFFTEDGVYRLSNHWGRAANCKWRLQNTTSFKRTKLGFARWTEFHPDNDIGKLYFIEMDADLKNVQYQHQSNLKSDEKVIFRTASETEKIIKKIRIILTTENWAKHYPMEINSLRKQIIDGLIRSTKTLQQIKSGLLNQIAE